MEGLRLVPAAASPQCRSVVASKSGLVAVAAALAVYLYRARDLKLQTIISGFNSNVVSLDWSVLEEEMLAIAAGDGAVVLWNAREHTAVRRLVVPTRTAVRCVRLSHHKRDNVFAIDESGRIYYAIGDQSFTEVYRTPVTEISAIDLHPRVPGLAAVGGAGGATAVVRLQGGKCTMLPCDTARHSGSVQELRWDICSDDYLLVGWRCGSIAMYDTEKQTVVMEFDPLPSPLGSLCWVPGEPGSFVASAQDTGIVRKWNVSSRAYTEQHQFDADGIRSFTYPLPQSDKALCIASDGTMWTYATRARKVVRSVAAGHSDTVFCCTSHTGADGTMATGSYEGYIKVWNLDLSTCRMTLPKEDSPVYSVSLAGPCDSAATELVAGLGDGRVTVHSLASGARLSNSKLHSSSVISVASHTFADTNMTIIASSSQDGRLLLSRLDGSVVARYDTRGGKAYGCDWSVREPGVLAVSVENGTTHVLDTQNGGTVRQKTTLTGHKGAAFQPRWSPFLLHTLATSGNDATVRIWDVVQGTCTVLKGHKSHARALLWHSDLPWVICSGSWDKTVRVWDTRAGACLFVLDEHLADVYGLAMQGRRSFSIATSSRDSTIQLWWLRGLSLPLALKAIAGKWESEAFVSTVEEADLLWQKSETGQLSSRIRMCSEGARSMAHVAARADSLAARLQVVLPYLLPHEGLATLLNAAQQLQLRRVQNGCAQVNHVIAAAKERAECHISEAHAAAEKARSKGRLSHVKRQEALFEAAHTMLQSGQITEYCKLMLAAGCVDHALAMAPSVSGTLWAELREQAAGEQMKCSRERKAVSNDCGIPSMPFLQNELIIKRAKAVMEDAWKVLTAPQPLAFAENLLQNCYFEQARAFALYDETRPIDTPLPDDAAASFLQTVTDTQVQYSIDAENYVAAATELVRDGRVGEAISMLCSYGLGPLAAAVGVCAGEQSLDDVIPHIAPLYLHYNMIAEGIMFVNRFSSDPRSRAEELVFRAASSAMSASERERLYASASLQPPRTYESIADSMAKEKRHWEAARAFALAGRTPACLQEISFATTATLRSKDIAEFATARSMLARFYAVDFSSMSPQQLEAMVLVVTLGAAFEATRQFDFSAARLFVQHIEIKLTKSPFWSQVQVLSTQQVGEWNAILAVDTVSSSAVVRWLSSTFGALSGSALSSIYFFLNPKHLCDHRSSVLT